MNKIGEKIKEARKKKGLSQEDLAESAKVNLRTIQRIEKNENEPRGKTLNLICSVLDINTEDILDYGKENDKSYLVIFHLSVLAFLVIPLGNIIMPLILWVNKKEKVIGLNTLGKNILNFQIVWSILSFTIMIILVTNPKYFSVMLYLMAFLTLTNLLLPIIFAIRTNSGKIDKMYPNIIKLIK
jgi:transcriptional regulator with XRE-family HTH domain